MKAYTTQILIISSAILAVNCTRQESKVSIGPNDARSFLNFETTDNVIIPQVQPPTINIDCDCGDMECWRQNTAAGMFKQIQCLSAIGKALMKLYGFEPGLRNNRDLRNAVMGGQKALFDALLSGETLKSIGDITSAFGDFSNATNKRCIGAVMKATGKSENEIFNIIRFFQRIKEANNGQGVTDFETLTRLGAEVFALFTDGAGIVSAMLDNAVDCFGNKNISPTKLEAFKKAIGRLEAFLAILDCAGKIYTGSKILVKNFWCMIDDIQRAWIEEPDKLNKLGADYLQTCNTRVSLPETGSVNDDLYRIKYNLDKNLDEVKNQCVGAYDYKKTDDYWDQQNKYCYHVTYACGEFARGIYAELKKKAEINSDVAYCPGSGPILDCTNSCIERFYPKACGKPPKASEAGAYELKHRTNMVRGRACGENAGDACMAGVKDIMLLTGKNITDEASLDKLIEEWSKVPPIPYCAAYAKQPPQRVVTEYEKEVCKNRLLSQCEKYPTSLGCYVYSTKPDTNECVNHYLRGTQTKHMICGMSLIKPEKPWGTPTTEACFNQLRSICRSPAKPLISEHDCQLLIGQNPSKNWWEFCNDSDNKNAKIKMIGCENPDLEAVNLQNLNGIANPQNMVMFKPNLTRETKYFTPYEGFTPCEITNMDASKTTQCTAQYLEGTPTQYGLCNSGSFGGDSWGGNGRKNCYNNLVEMCKNKLLDSNLFAAVDVDLLCGRVEDISQDRLDFCANSKNPNTKLTPVSCTEYPIKKTLPMPYYPNRKDNGITKIELIHIEPKFMGLETLNGRRPGVMTGDARILIHRIEHGTENCLIGPFFTDDIIEALPPSNEHPDGDTTRETGDTKGQEPPPPTK